MKREEMTESEKRIWDQVYAIKYAKYDDAYYAIGDADRAIYDLRREQKKGR